MPDEVRMLDNRNALLFVRGERPVIDLKYDLARHPNIALTADGGAAPYIHGLTDYAHDLESVMLPGDMNDYAVLSEAEIEQLVHEWEQKQKKTTEVNKNV